MSAILQLNEKLKAFEKQKQDLIKALRKDLKSVLKELFTTIPEIKTIYWTQYTPYFMDGDECIFGINEIMVSNTDKAFVSYPEDLEEYLEEEDSEKHLWADYATSVNKKLITNAEHRKTLREFVNIIHKSDDLIKEIFGDHVRVIGTKTGFRIEDYSDHY